MANDSSSLEYFSIHKLGAPAAKLHVASEEARSRATGNPQNITFVTIFKMLGLHFLEDVSYLFVMIPVSCFAQCCNFSLAFCLNESIV